LRSYFEDAIARPSTDDLPAEVAQARSKLNSLKPIRTPAAKRAHIAHLLYHLDAHVGVAEEARDTWYRQFIPPQAAKEGEAPAATFKMRSADEDLLEGRIAWHQRVVAVVGLEAYVAAVEAQASQLNQIQQQLQSRIRDEQSQFEKQYQDEVDRCKTQAKNLDELLQALAKKNVEKAARTAELTNREAEKADLENKLAAATAAAKKALQDLEMKVDELFQITKQLGDAQDALVGLEIDLRNLELGPPPAKKK
jgi:hypothetical protein